MNQDKQFGGNQDMLSGGNQDKLSGGNLTDYAKKRMAYYAVMFAKSSDEELRQTRDKEGRRTGWTQERSFYLYALREEWAKRHLEMKP